MTSRTTIDDTPHAGADDDTAGAGVAAGDRDDQGRGPREGTLRTRLALPRPLGRGGRGVEADDREEDHGLLAGPILRPWTPPTELPVNRPAARATRAAGWADIDAATVSAGGLVLMRLNAGRNVDDADGTGPWSPTSDDTPGPTETAGAGRHDGVTTGATVATGPASWAPEVLDGPLAKVEPISDGEAQAFACMFAVDYQSWDEDDSARRAETLRGYLADPRAQSLGWSGVGRQRADTPLAGRQFRRSATEVIVEVKLRVTSYARVAPPPAETTAPRIPSTEEPPAALGPSSAPASDPDAWLPGRAWWVQMVVPVTRDRRGQLVVDLALLPTTSGT